MKAFTRAIIVKDENDFKCFRKKIFSGLTIAINKGIITM